MPRTERIRSPRIRNRMIGLSDSQLEIIMSTAEPLGEGKCQEFLERVAEAVGAVVQVRGQINDDDVQSPCDWPCVR